MALMKRHLLSLLAALFILSTLFSSLHELMPHHSSSDCQVCTFTSHDGGLAPETTQVSLLIKPIFHSPTILHSITATTPITLDNPRAPPYFS